MPKQSRITFSLNLNVNLFLTRVFSIYIQFVPILFAPGLSALSGPTWEFAKLLLLLPSSELYCSQRCSACSVSPAETVLQWGESSENWAQSPGQWRHTSWPPGVNTIPDTTSTRSRPSWGIRSIIRIIKIPEDPSQATSRESRPDRPGSRWDTANKWGQFCRGLIFHSMYILSFYPRDRTWTLNKSQTMWRW